jgi:hypothetical protein
MGPLATTKLANKNRVDLAQTIFDFQEADGEHGFKGGALFGLDRFVWALGYADQKHDLPAHDVSISCKRNRRKT